MHLVLCLIVTSILSSCSTTKKMEVISESGNVANLKGTYKEFYFAPSATTAAVKARQFFASSARAEAARKGKTIEAVSLFSADVKRNEMTGYYTFEMEGRMRYGQEPFTGPVFSDHSPLLMMARTSQQNSERLNAAIFGMSQGLSESVARNQESMNNLRQTQAIEAQNMELRQLRHSVDNATRSLNSSVPIYPTGSTIYLR